ncbi:ubiquitin conjugating enzyme family protein [Ephemerocybe angulata]|uniref:Ubiquitin conjugating enzyme family protein n=1 Tax=Ephemerocybe angulata TaxID=980116 RepID=A0A8H6IE87_9AGAR|nr:ubiquitin conjugating enzyme family protein [Tulosesus angulatus]
MSESEVQQLVEMGASRAQARAALKQYKDVMEAAERFFDGAFDNVKDDDGDVAMSPPSPKKKTIPVKSASSDEEDDDGMYDSDDGAEDFLDYDDEFEDNMDKANGVPDVDPYAGIFFSKDRREEVIEIEEEPEIYTHAPSGDTVKLLTQGQWMKGCPEKGEQNFLFGLYSQFTETEFKCPHDCGAVIRRNKGDFFALYPDFSTYIDRLRSVVRARCTRCHSEVCLACREPVSTEKERSNRSSDPLFHCSDLQGIILGMGLLMLEQTFQGTDEEPANESAEQTSKSNKRRKTDNGSNEDSSPSFLGLLSGVGSKKAKGGIGYAGEQREDLTGQLEAQASQKAKDEKLGNSLSAIRVFLPNLHRPEGGHSSDYLVHPTALAHLRRRFNHICSTLLRNDSLADMSDRSVLYFELLNWLETISNHEALASMMAMPIMVVASVKEVKTLKRSPKSSAIRERTIVYEGSASPRELLEGLAIQARAAIKGLEGSKTQETVEEELTEEQKRMTVDTKGKETASQPVLSDDNQKLLDFCQRILSTINAIDRSLREVKGDAFVDRLHESLPKLTTSTGDLAKYRVDNSTTAEMTRKIYMDWVTKARFEYCDLSIPIPSEEDDGQPPHYKFFFDAEARMLVNSDIPKRSLAIAKELAILTTNMPVAWDSSILLKVDETRVDIIKALIIGPEGTPYQNGCFLFDIFLGPSYNQSPPSVKYMTTNGGKFRFNPNLYADGKVCLSLLGTWSGPGWVAGRSTLLQVLISIQSMILCEEPYLNEPGWAQGAGTPPSQAYSANVRRMVVKTAMLGNLKNPPEPFGDIIRTHFRLKAKSISAQLDDWLRKDDGKPLSGEGAGYSPGREPAGTGSSNGFAKDIEELKAAMQKLQTEAA